MRHNTFHRNMVTEYSLICLSVEEARAWYLSVGNADVVHELNYLPDECPEWFVGFCFHKYAHSFTKRLANYPLQVGVAARCGCCREIVLTDWLLGCPETEIALRQSLDFLCMMCSALGSVKSKLAGGEIVSDPHRLTGERIRD